VEKELSSWESAEAVDVGDKKCNWISSEWRRVYLPGRASLFAATDEGIPYF